MKWFVVKTKRNQEIKVADALNAIGINAFCPVISFVKQYSDRKKKIQKAAMPSYVLVNIDDNKRVDVFNIPGVIKYLFWLGKPAIVRSEEIDLLKNELESLYAISHNHKLEKNTDHTLISGLFKGLKGKVLNISNNKFKLELKNIGVHLTVNLA
jgi:transcription antitermination factor NusG